jgi:polyferredoxin
MGIDIRNGQQLACITCALCIDACNEVMDKIGKPTRPDRLSGPDRRDGRTRRQAPKSVWKHVFRPRTMLYTVLWAAVGIALVVALFLRSRST